MMKKMSIFLGVLLLVVILAVPASAEQTANMTLSAQNATVDVMQEITVVVSISEVHNWKDIAIVFQFDRDVFEYVPNSIEGLDGAQGFVPSISTAANKLTGLLSVYNAPPSEKPAKGDIFQIKLKVKEGVPYGTYEITGEARVTTNQQVSCTVNTLKVTVACSHSYGYEKIDEDTHKYVCSKCGVFTTEEHDWNDGRVDKRPSCTEPGKQTLTCLACRATKEEPIPATGHSWDNDCDTSCNSCGQQREITHNYSERLANDKTGHWYPCNICGSKKDFAEHTPGAEATEETDQICTVCEYVIAKATGHKHIMSDAWSSDEMQHWHRCEIADCFYVEDEEIHEYDSGCDAQCNICGYERSAPPHNFSEDWKGGPEGHWHMCMDCFATSETVPHTPGPAATETDPQICLDCEIVIQMPLSHTHIWGENWYSNDEYHWQCCTDSSCIEVHAMEPHNWSAASVLANRDILYICGVCGKQVVTAGEEPPTAPSTVPTTQAPTVPQKDGGERDFPWEIVGIAAAVLLLIGLVLLVIEFIRSRRINSHGKYSK